MHLLYITTNFHSLTLTFVTREVDQLRRLGHKVSLMSLRAQRDGGAAQPECDLSGCIYVFPVGRVQLLGSVLRTVLRRPRRFGHALWLALSAANSGWGLRLKLAGQLAAATTVLGAVERTGATHLHAHLASPPGNHALFLSLLADLPFSFTGHAADLYRKPEILPVKLRQAAAAIAISEFNRDLYLRLVPGYDRAPLVHCGVRLGDFPYRTREAPGRPLRILAVGRAAEKKGFTHLLDALAILDRRGIPWQGHLVGDGPLLAAHREQAARLGLTNLDITGALQQPQVRDLLAAADVFVLPCVEAADGDIDGIPVALMEAMASGCPVVSTRLSGIPELVVDGHTGLLAEPGNAVALADALQRLASESDLTARLSRHGREHVAQSFNLEVETAKLAEVFAATYAEGPRRSFR